MMDIAMIDPSGFTLPYDRHLCRALANTGADVTLVSDSLTNKTDDSNYEMDNHFYTKSNAVFSRSSSSKARLFFKGFEHIIDIFTYICQARHEYDLLHFQWLPLPIFDYLAISKLNSTIPTVLTVHDTTPYRNNPSSKIQQLGSYQVLKKFDRLIVHTQYSKRRLTNKGIDESRVSIVPHGVLEGNNVVNQPEESNYREKFNILFFGTIKEYKGLDNLIYALAELDEKTKKQVIVRIAGKPQMDINQLQSLSERLSVDHLINWELGFVPDDEVPRLFANSDAVILPYNHIDQSGVLMKSISYGLPIIATKVGGIPEVITDGVHGRLVPPQEPSELAEAISSIVYMDGYDKIANEVAELADTTYSWERIANETICIYQSIIQSS